MQITTTTDEAEPPVPASAVIALTAHGPREARLLRELDALDAELELRASARRAGRDPAGEEDGS